MIIFQEKKTKLRNKFQRNETLQLKVTSHLRRKKIRTRANFTKIPANFASEESLITAVYDKCVRSR